MVEKKLLHAFSLTSEEHADMFERYANAFLLDDYPELEAVGAKKDKGMDARIVEESGKNLLVVQSCVSPTTSARTKVLGTFAKLQSNLPETLVYCTPAHIGLSLDVTKKELRHSKVRLDVCDGTWFEQRIRSSESRTSLSRAYAEQVLHPLLYELDPNRLYSDVLSDTEELRVARYLEAHSLDKKKGRNFTKSLFDSLILSVLDEQSGSSPRLLKSQLIDAICSCFPQGHHQRINEIVPARLNHLLEKNAVRRNGGDSYELTPRSKASICTHKSELKDREIAFRASIADAVQQAMVENEIDYKVDQDKLEQLIHHCILWYMREQSKQLQDPATNLCSVLNTEELITLYLDSGKPSTALSKEHVLDIAPTALFSLISSGDAAIGTYLRSKADLFISHAFLQATPDVQKACKKLFGGDLIFADTTVLIHCLAERYAPGSPRLLTQTLSTARKLGIKVRTFRPFVEELTAHLRGPVLLEWQNNFAGQTGSAFNARLKTAPILIEVLHRAAENSGRTVPQLVEEVTGTTNHVDNAAEFLKEEFSIQVQDTTPADDDAQRAEWQHIYGEWLEAKRKYPNMTQERFETLVKNDVDAYTSILRLRKTLSVSGENYGHKVWILTLDRMYWKMKNVLRKKDDHSYHVAMSMDYLANYVATLSNLESQDTDDINLPALLITQAGEYIPSQLRNHFATEIEDNNAKTYMKRRRIRELVHEAKTSGWEFDTPTDVSTI